MKKLFCIACCSLFLLGGCGKASYFQSTELVEKTEDTNATEQVVDELLPTTIYVQVAGAVKSPDVYELPEGSRVYAAIEAAGGLIESADDSDINQAALLEDGQKLYVYTVEETKALEAKQAAVEADDGLININTATLLELRSLPGIGESKANQIIAYREANGNFSSIEDIKKVSGIGDGIFNQINSLIKI
ncbi:competence protein ComEA [Pseudobutyrivibrio sp. OR37]|uniref:ComEA family DNA-binding protein n=1 Tax=Pseudobutyrivibrio sp. OR37 TaxID=1798186 RepID=UPI0008F2D481|nr:ComEA family DNA-binding protein [Pseudobutyrivibrio sp. OR37]SFH52454.1 competence protein ComEA [Pseudobutyrivibrio sp. OR37]